MASMLPISSFYYLIKNSYAANSSAFLLLFQHLLSLPAFYNLVIIFPKIQVKNWPCPKDF